MSGKIQSSYELWAQLKKIIPDLPDRCREMTLTVRFDEAPTITTVCIVGKTDGGQLEEVTETFRLVPVEPMVACEAGDGN